LPFSATEQALQTKFSAHGRVESCKLITDRDTGQSKGFGFVEMGTDSEASAAIAALNGADFEGRAMKVNEAKPMEKRSGGGGGRGGYGGGGGGRGGGGGYGGGDGGGGGRW
jgi:cold-inducible RNA-binding protein